MPEFWGLCCGDKVRVSVEAVSRPIDRRLVEGDYENDRDFRREVHQWLADIWEQKDALISDRLLETLR